MFRSLRCYYVTVPIKRVFVGASWVKLASRNIMWQWINSLLPCCIWNLKTATHKKGWSFSTRVINLPLFYLFNPNIPRYSALLIVAKKIETVAYYCAKVRLRFIRNTTQVFRLYKTQTSVSSHSLIQSLIHSYKHTTPTSALKLNQLLLYSTFFFLLLEFVCLHVCFCTL